MDKKSSVIILCIGIAVIVLLCLLLPRTSSVTLHAVKLDATGQVVGQVEIPLKYTAASALSKRLKRVTISEFDGFCGITITDASRGVSPFRDYLSITVGVGNHTGDLPTPDNPSFDGMQSQGFRCIVEVSPDLDRWMIRIQDTDSKEEFIYVSSVSGADTAQQLLDYFDFKYVDADMVQ